MTQVYEYPFLFVDNHYPTATSVFHLAKLTDQFAPRDPVSSVIIGPFICTNIFANYGFGNTRSGKITEVKQLGRRLALGWVTIQVLKLML